jgi:hypothetical protein
MGTRARLICLGQAHCLSGEVRISPGAMAVHSPKTMTHAENRYRSVEMAFVNGKTPFPSRGNHRFPVRGARSTNLSIQGLP